MSNELWAIWWKTPKYEKVWAGYVKDAVNNEGAVSLLMTPSVAVVYWEHNTIRETEIWADCYVRALSKDKLISMWKEESVAKMLKGEIPGPVFYEVEEHLSKNSLLGNRSNEEVTWDT